MARGVELGEVAVGVGALQAEDLVAEDVLAGPEGRRQRHGPRGVLLGQALRGPGRPAVRRRPVRVVPGLVDLDPDVARRARERRARPLAVG